AGPVARKRRARINANNDADKMFSANEHNAQTVTIVPTRISNPAIVPQKAGAIARPSNLIAAEIASDNTSVRTPQSAITDTTRNRYPLMRRALSANAGHGRIRSKTTSGTISNQLESFRTSTTVSNKARIATITQTTTKTGGRA